MKLILASLLFSTSALFSTAAIADADTDNRLTAIRAEIIALQSMVVAAKAGDPKTGTLTFAWDRLETDLKTIELGIDQHLSGIKEVPRKIVPLAGEYRR